MKIEIKLDENKLLEKVDIDGMYIFDSKHKGKSEADFYIFVSTSDSEHAKIELIKKH